MSTLFALYLATEVESYAHSTLYEYFPHKYYPIADEDLPRVIKDKEMIRRRTGLVTSEGASGRVWDDSYLSVDGMVVIDDTNVGGEELMAEQQLESDLTGGNDMTNDLIMMKLASGLLSKKTGQSGVRGFLDVLGQAGSDTTDVAMALFQKERDRRT